MNRNGTVVTGGIVEDRSARDEDTGGVHDYVYHIRVDGRRGTRQVPGTGAWGHCFYPEMDGIALGG